MALDPNRWTLKTQEAVSAAVESAKQASNPEVTPDHLLAALLGQSEGIVLPILQRLGKEPLPLRNQVGEALAKLPKAYGSEARLSREHNDLNVIALGARVLPESRARDIVRTFLETRFEGGRHAARVAKIEGIRVPGVPGAQLVP